MSLDGSVVEAAATQYLGVTGTPATQTTASLGTGTYTLWCEGTGSCIASAGTATITGAAAASAGAPDQFEVTVAGTVTVTVTGSLTTFNLTNTPYQTSYIANAGAAGTSTTRNKDVLDDQVASNLTAAAGSVAFQWTPSHAPSGTVAPCGSYVDASNYTMLLAQKVTNLLAAPEDITNAAYSASTATRTSATVLTGVGADSYLIAGSAVSTDTYAMSAKVTRITGTGAIAFSANNGGAYTNIDVTTTPTRFRLTTAGGHAGFVIRIATDGDQIRVEELQYENVTANVSKFAAPYTATTDTFAIFRKVVAGAAYDAYLQHAYVSGTTYDIALKWGASGSNLAVDGVLGTANTTGIEGVQYGKLPGTAGAYFSTPDSVAASITGDIDIRVKAALTDWTPAVQMVLIARRLSTDASYVFRILTDGTLSLYWYTSGAVFTQVISSASVVGVPSVGLWLRFTRAGTAVNFYQSSDGSAWTAIGVEQTAASASTTGDTLGVYIGSTQDESEPLLGNIYRAQIYNGIDGTLAVDFNPADYTHGTTWTSSTTGEVYTINGNAAVWPAVKLSTRWQWGSDGNGGQQAGAALKEMRLFTEATSNADLVAMTL